MNQEGKLFSSPLFYNFPNDEKTYLISDQYMVGDSIMVAPIIDKDMTKRIVYFPSGTWID